MRYLGRKDRAVKHQVHLGLKRVVDSRLQVPPDKRLVDLRNQQAEGRIQLAHQAFRRPRVHPERQAVTLVKSIIIKVNN